ncbi:hypothetical protein V5097_19145 [Arenibacter palladensis]|uniref:hypothetical protein n=1 Tax=Arenibacter palladensis TaxID=237373 RepID=UPI002FD00AE7
MASVGISEEEARRKYNNVGVSYNSGQDWFSAKRINSPAYAFKVIWNNSTKLILGAHLLGSNAAEISTFLQWLSIMILPLIN